MTIANNNYVVGSGRLLFNPFVAGTFAPATPGFRYFGNTPDLTFSQSVDTLDHYDSDGPSKQKDAQVDISRDMTGSFSTDNISSENLALWFAGAAATTVVAAAPGQTLTVAANRGDEIQLGVTAGTPMGSGVSNVVVKLTNAAGAVIATPANYTVDLARGVIKIDPAAPVIPTLNGSAGTVIYIAYDVPAATLDQVISSGKTIVGQLKFESSNRSGDNRDHFYPYVKITPNGDYALKGDTFQTMSFNLEVLKLNASTERDYITKR